MNPDRGHSLDFGTEALNSLVESSPWQSTQELAKISNTSQSAIYQHLEKIKSASWVFSVPYTLSEKNKVNC